ncbi:MAG: bifunctional DNA-formamidopyrimidine glycosylase/DNA-(apurinic or apyrimidinic site) lyase [Selenomonadaceae bacterium]
MPEMPEVEIIRRSLINKLKGKQIVQIEILLARQIKWPDRDGFVAMTVGRHIIDIGRKGKYLLLLLDNGNTIVFHLRMTGRLCYTLKEASQDLYKRIIFLLDDGNLLIYADTRTLGTIYALAPGEEWRIEGLSHMGVEPLTEDFTEGYLYDVMYKSKAKIKSFLLNQKKISGLGNIYADECLHMAGIHPLRLAGSLMKNEIAQLHMAINKVIADGIRDGGTTFRDYRNGEGEKGHHQENLFVYGRDGKPCKVCGTIIEKIVVGGRGTHFCPNCQKLREES